MSYFVNIFDKNRNESMLIDVDKIIRISSRGGDYIIEFWGGLFNVVHRDYMPPIFNKLGIEMKYGSPYRNQ